MENPDSVGTKGSRPQTRQRAIWKSVILAVAFSVLAISLLFYYTKADLSKAFTSVNFLYLAAALGLIILNWVLEAGRLVTILDAVDCQLSFARALQIALVGSFFANITPFDSGREPLQIYLLSKNGVSAGKSTAVVLVKTIMSTVARLALALGIPTWLLITKTAWSLPSVLNTALNVGIVLYVIFTGALVFFLFRPQLLAVFLHSVLSWKLLLRFWKSEQLELVEMRILREANSFHDSIHMLTQANKRNLILVAFYSILLWVMTLSVPALLLWGMGVYSPLLQILAVSLIFYLAAAYAPTPGSTGISEAGFAAIFFASNLIPYPLLGVFVLLWRFLTYYLSLLVGGIVSFFTFLGKKR
jgi:uncharacterized protein (TIRG00374 family)